MSNSMNNDVKITDIEVRYTNLKSTHIIRIWLNAFSETNHEVSWATSTHL